MAAINYDDKIPNNVELSTNRTLQRAGGSFRLLVNRQSPIFKVLQMMKMHLLVNILETAA